MNVSVSRYLARLTFLILLCAPFTVHAATLDGTSLGLVWILPFVGTLLSIAIFPVVAPVFWHHHYGKVIAAWALVFLVPCVLVFGIPLAWRMVTHAILAEWLPFIILLFSLYTISGGILVWGRLHGTPKLNVYILALGTALASLMGTTGAAMLLIRPLLKANKNRRHRVHTFIFFIFLVANIGGGITPLGDPPLFMGYLKGISFAWTIRHMFLPVLLCCAILLLLYYLLDRHYYRKEIDTMEAPKPRTKFKILGRFNFILLLGVVIVVFLSGIWHPGIQIELIGISVPLESLARDILLIILALISLVFTPRPVRAGNEFSWAPMLEVAKLFAGIFITIAPAIIILQAGEQGALSLITRLVSTQQGEPVNAIYFWTTGILSSFLDNAPTYLVFFNLALAHNDVTHLMGPMASTLMAISMGAVFMGANTYIGNAPNFMVKSIVEQANIKMPSFFGYMLWSGTILLPLFALLTLIFF